VPWLQGAHDVTSSVGVLAVIISHIVHVNQKKFRDMGEPEGAIIPLFSNRGYMDPLSFSLGINNQV
jgi:hypothetical protein